jgi:PAS domain S-box-containing protein
MLLDYFHEIKDELLRHSEIVSNEVQGVLLKNPFSLLKHLSLDLKDDGIIAIDEYDKWFEGLGLLHDVIQQQLYHLHEDLIDVNESLLTELEGVNFYIIDEGGGIVFNLNKTGDYYKNILSDDFNGTKIQECIKELKKKNFSRISHKSVVLTDLSNYKYFKKHPVFFAGIPFKISNSKGYIVMMLSYKKINRIMTKWTGLGESGETYLVGVDYKMRNDSRFIIQEPNRFFKMLEKRGYDNDKIKKMKASQTTVLLQTINTASTLKALQGEEGTEVIKDYRGARVLSAYSSMRFGNITWAILSELDAAEALRETIMFRNNMIRFSIVIIVALLFMSNLLAKKMSKRLILLKESSYRVSRGDYNVNLQPEGHDEIDELTRSFCSMTVDLKEKEEELLAKNLQLEEKVKDRTKELEAEKEFSDKIVSAATSFIVGVNRSGTIELVNDAFTKISACRKDELIGTSLFNLITDEQGSGFKDFIQSETSERGHFDVTIKTKKFEKKIISWDAAALRTKTGEGLTILVGQDITDRIKLENSLRKKTQEIESFVYTVSHDLKNPAISLMGMLDLFLEDCSDNISEQGHFYLKRLKANAITVNELLQALLDVSRITRIEVAKEDVSVSTIIKQVIHENRQLIEELNAKIEIGDDLPILYFTKMRLYQVFSNLLKNALKFSREDVPLEIKIGSSETENEFIIFIQDNGIGIDEQYHSKVFEMFTRLREKESEGTGIGLTIVKRIIDESGDRIWVESKKGEGTTFYIAIHKKIVYPEVDETCCVNPTCGDQTKDDKTANKTTCDDDTCGNCG